MRLLVLPVALVSLACASPLAAQPSGESDAPSDTSTTQTLAPGVTLTLVPVPADGADLSVCDTWHGIDGDQPGVIVSEGWIERDGQRLMVDVSCMAVDYGTELYGLFVEPVEGTDNLLVGGTFSDGAGTADIEWLVGTVGTVRTSLVSGPDLFEARQGGGDVEVDDRLDVLAEGLVALRDGTTSETSALAGELYEVLIDLAALLAD